MVRKEEDEDESEEDDEEMDQDVETFLDHPLKRLNDWWRMESQNQIEEHTLYVTTDRAWEGPS